MASLTTWGRRHTTYGVRRAVANLWAELQSCWRDQAGLRKAKRTPLRRGARLQFGSGGRPKPGCVNIDLYAAGADLVLDLREDLPFPDQSVSEIYSEHIFEHFEYPTDARHLLRESLRVLVPGGVFRIVVPDCGALLLAYARQDLTLFEPDRLRSYLLEEPPTFMHHGNYWFRQDGLHRYGYDAETLGHVLRDIGFVNVRARAYDPDLDSEKRYLLHSLYMEAATPSLARRPAVIESSRRTEIESAGSSDGAARTVVT